MTRKELDDRVLQPPDGGFGAPPPPSPELLAAMQRMRPVRTRTRAPRPFRRGGDAASRSGLVLLPGIQ